MKSGVITFPGSNCDKDIAFILEKYYNHSVTMLWHRDQFHSNDYDLIVLPGGFSYGDYLRCGSMASLSPVMQSVREHVSKGKMLIGICNGFQILLEAKLLPGALVSNQSLKHICKNSILVKGSSGNLLTSKISENQPLKIPISHGEGCYFAEQDTIKKLNEDNCILFKYHGENPNGSVENIAGITSPDFKIVGLMPHPERAVEEISGSTDGRLIFDSFFAN